MNKAKEYLEFLILGLVDHPEEMRVEARTDEMGVLLTLHVAQEDMGQIIGAQGATAKSIRNLLRIVGVKQNARVNLKIAEPGEE